MSRAPTDQELKEILEAELSGRIVRLTRRPYVYRTSYPLEELDVALADGRSVRLVLKDLSRHGLDEKVRLVKPDFLHDPRREIETYRHILAPGNFGTPRFHGSVVAPERDVYWLLVEKVEGRELWQEGAIAVWQEAARWLAILHTRLASEAERLADPAHLLRQDEAFYYIWQKRAREFLSRRLPDLEILERVFFRYDWVVERLLAQPVTIVHGEFYASNVLVQDRTEGIRICPVDWEMTGLGPGLIDLAALSAGKWTDAERRSLAMAYHEQLGLLGGQQVALPAFFENLDYCRLHLAVQWLGWVDQWTPPAEHASDWLGEARRLAQELGL